RIVAERGCLVHVRSLRHFELQRMNVVVGTAISTRYTTAGKSSVDHMRKRFRVGEHLRDERLRILRATRAVHGAEIEIRQASGEKTRHFRSDGMRVEQNRIAMMCTHALDLGCER